MKLPLGSLATFLALAVLGCTPPSGGSPGEAPTGNDATAASSGADEAKEAADRKACDARAAALTKEGRAYGTGLLEQHRERFLGRARGATTLFVREPKATAISD
ncbi:MAG: hypothetical protein JNK04_26220, partial [Myxococcales bacterium]|nr:hypothetical protein [Myxococcales bacterium]